MKNLLAIMKREFGYIFSNRRLLIIIFIIPIFYTLLFGYLYINHLVTGMKTAIIDQNKTQLSRSIIEGFDKNDKFALVKTLDSPSQIKEHMENGTIDVAIVIPKDFATDVMSSEEAPILIIVNGSNMIISNSVTVNALGIIQTYSTGIAANKLQATSGVPFEQAVNQVNPISIRIRPWYNPTYNYTNFLLLGLIATAIQQVSLLYVAVSFAREKDRGTLSELNALGGNAFTKVMGKILPYFTINLAALTVSLLIARYLYKVPFRGSITALIFLSILFIFCIDALGVFLSLICSNELEATQIAMLVAIPSFLFSGFTWPIQAMPIPCQALAKILPLTYFTQAIRKIDIMGLSWFHLQQEIFVLIIMTLVLLPAAILTYKFKYAKLTAADNAININ